MYSKVIIIAHQHLIKNQCYFLSSYSLGIILFINFSVCCHGYPSYQNNIPNGHKVPHPCGGNNEWCGVGHQFSKGGGPLNPFGIDLHKNKLDNRQVIIFLKSAILK